jgi:hypothetical protein
VIKDALVVLDTGAPQLLVAGVVGGKTYPLGVEVGGLDDYEAVRGPEVGQGA